MQGNRCFKQSLALFFAFFLFLSFSVQAENNSFIKDQIEQINKVIADNSTGPNDPKAAFSVDYTNRVITLTFERSISLAGQDKGILQMISTQLPNILIQTVYLKTAGIINGQVIGARLIEALQNDNYTMKVIIKGTDQQFEFDYPIQSLTL